MVHKKTEKCKQEGYGCIFKGIVPKTKVKSRYDMEVSF